MPADESTDHGELVADPARPKRHRTWPERLAIVGTFGTAFVCLLTAVALVGAYLVVRQKNVVDLAAPSALTAADRDGDGRPGGVTVAPRIDVEAPATDVAAATAPPAAIDPAGSDPSTTAVGSPGITAATSGITTRPSSAGTGQTSTTERTVAPTTTPLAAKEPAPPTTFPPADPEAKNFLITGADNGACIAPDSPYADAFGDRDDMGERSDTIMVVRVDPQAARVAVLSFPRDLWVEIAGSGSMQRINSAYKRNEPQRLVDTIYDEFDITIDHYIQFDFCAFKTLVDAVGGIEVPFAHPTRDTRTGLYVEQPGCVNLDGEAALAYVRSRYYEYDASGEGDWTRDRSSDLGRISRQQDFIRRTLATVSEKGLMNPDVVRGLLRAADKYIVTDRQLTPKRVLEFAGVMSDVDPDSIVTYQISSTPRSVNGNDVLIPELDNELMRDVLGVFRGEVSLGDAPSDQPRAGATTSPGTGGAVGESLTLGLFAALASSDDDGGDGDAATTAGGPAPTQDVIGIVPPADEHC